MITPTPILKYFLEFLRFDVNSDMSSNIERKLAAIMFTDIAGYTAQMSKDEAVAISLLNKKNLSSNLLLKNIMVHMLKVQVMAVYPTLTLLLMLLCVLKNFKNLSMMIKI